MRIAPRTQVVIDKDFQNNGIYKHLLNGIKIQISEKYDALFGVVAKSNPKIFTHKQVGWELLHEDNNWYYVLYVLNY